MSDQKRKHTAINVINTNKEDNTDKKNFITVELGKVKMVNSNKGEDNIDIAFILSGHEGMSIYHVMFGNVVICNVTKDKIYFYSKNCKGEKFFVDNIGKLHEEGECLIFPSKTERDWTKFTADHLKPGDYIVIGNNKCILSKALGCEKSDHGMMFDTTIAIAGEDDLYPNKVVFNHIFHVMRDKVRKATIEERKEIDAVLEKVGLVFDNETKSIIRNKWYPKHDEIYYNLLINGACRFFVTESKWDGSLVDIDRYENGNCFKTREEANHWCAKFNNSSEEVSKQLTNR